MKDIDEREARRRKIIWYEVPFDGVTAKSALRKASEANIDGTTSDPMPKC
jgi:hypothetical protein